MATDGVNVYFAGQYGGLSCPISGLGANCTHIMAGPWPCKKNSNACSDTFVFGLAASGGQIWTASNNGNIYRCPANLPYYEQEQAPSQCVLLDDAGDRGVYSLLLANGRLYAGLSNINAGAYQDKKEYGLLWSCDLYTQNACSEIDRYGETKANALAVGGGYLWAGLDNGIIWRCDLNTANACSNWENASHPIRSLSYGGQGTLYATIGHKGPIWSCPTAYANGCSNVLDNVWGWSVAAGEGGVFSSTDSALYFGTSAFRVASTSLVNSTLLSIPAAGPVGVGSASLQATPENKPLARKLKDRCEAGWNLKATVTVTGPNDVGKTLKIGVCDLVKGGMLKTTVDLLDAGDYTASVQAGKQSGTASFTIEPDTVRPVKVNLSRGSTGG